MIDRPEWTLDRPVRRRRWFRLLAGATVLSATIVITMVVFEGSMIFFPDRYPIGNWDTSTVGRAGGVAVEDRFFVTADGVRLHGWWCRPIGAAAAAPTADTVLLWFHGNAGNLAQRADQMVALARMPMQVFIVDYRGYGRSEGRPSESGLYRDARAAWHHLTDDAGVEADRIVVLGVSLGGAVAVDLAAEVDPAGLIVQSSFTSVADMAAHHYPFIPRWLIRTRLDSASRIGRVRCPILIAHSPDDDVVPFELGRRLYDAATGDRRFFEIPGAAHNETWIAGGAEYLETLRRFVAHCTEAER
ncbi:MAG: alpha/beta hydrolase [Holophagae bacterium]|jgi:hypothetical protein